MRFTIELPTVAVDLLRAQADAAHRPPKYHAEWLLMQALHTQSVAEHAASMQALRQVATDIEASLSAGRQPTDNGQVAADEVPA